jgi:Pvc16 N-terminal domain
MSNSLAVAAVTATLQSILQHEVMTESDLSDLSVTIQPLDIARGKNTHNQLNLFLYMVVRNAAWSNADMPRQVQPGEVAIPPLALNLYYLLTAFGRDDDVAQPFGHELLGKAMSVLHDHPVLSAADIIAATQGALPGSDLAQQIERIRLTLHPLTIDELSKLWTGFAMQYRLSAAYEVDVALIDSTRAARAGLPVLTRGPGDQGVTAQSNLTPPVPTLTGLTLPKNQSSALLNDVVTLTGVHLDGSNIGVQFSHPLLAAPITVLPQPGGAATSLSVQIPNQAALWPAGFYTVVVLVQRPGETFRRTTNALALPLAPALTIAPASAPAGNIVYTVTVTPDVWPAQGVTLILGDNEFLADPHPSQTGTLVVSTAGLVAGGYWVRLRIDGVDSLLVDRTKTPPIFDPTQKVTVT